MKLVLVVCTANICRSPMAAAILRKRIHDLGLSDEVEVQSAGVWARPNQPASRLAIEVLAKHDVPLAEHRSQLVTMPLLQKSHLVLVMEEEHRKSLFYTAPQYLSKVYLLSEMAGGSDDIEDPYGRSIEYYEDTREALEELIDAGLPNILKRLGLSVPPSA